MDEIDAQFVELLARDARADALLAAAIDECLRLGFHQREIATRLAHFLAALCREQPQPALADE